MFSLTNFLWPILHQALLSIVNGQYIWFCFHSCWQWEAQFVCLIFHFGLRVLALLQKNKIDGNWNIAMRQNEQAKTIPSECVCVCVFRVAKALNNLKGNFFYWYFNRKMREKKNPNRIQTYRYSMYFILFFPKSRRAYFGNGIHLLVLVYVFIPFVLCATQTTFKQTHLSKI